MIMFSFISGQKTQECYQLAEVGCLFSLKTLTAEGLRTLISYELFS